MLRNFLGGDDKNKDKTENSDNNSSNSKNGENNNNNGADALLKQEQEKRETRLREEPTLRSAEHEEKSHKDKWRSKLRESAISESRTAGGGPGLGYDSLLRPASRVMPLDPQSSQDYHEGIKINAARSVQNINVQSQWTLGNPQHSNWEYTFQMQGFSDVNSVSYTTGGKWTLIHQRMFRNGAFGMLQFMMNPQMGPMGNTFVMMMMYPWAVHGGTTQFSYVKGQQTSLSHAARLVRGVDVGASMTYEIPTNSTSVSYAFRTTSADKTRNWCGSINPETGAWKLAVTKYDWNSDLEVGAQMELSDKKGQLVPSFAVGFRKPLIGGGLVHVINQNFYKLKALVELPFGGERVGLNQVKLNWMVQYDARDGGAKHGVTLSF
jgi:hypothetical protein